jgi:WD40 repeat protein
MTLMLCYHSYESLLMLCGGIDIVSLWNVDTGKKLADICSSNGNVKCSRMTASAWINEDVSSLFMVGCDDGTVHLWGNLAVGEPQLVSRGILLR